MDKKLLLGAAMVTLTGIAAQNVMAATDALVVEAKIVNPTDVIVNATQDLHFGAFLAPVGPETATIDTAGGLGTSAGLTQIGGPVAQEGLLRILADATSDIVVNVTDTSVAVSNGTATMLVNNFNLNTVAAGPTISLNMGAATTTVVPVGATLNVGANQPSGTYTGTVTIAVIYN